MSAIDDIMAKCPLKQEVRGVLWEPYARRIAPNRPLSSYLTLYSPPMMDIKHFENQGLLDFDGEQYLGVTAVTYDDNAYEEAIRRLKGRPERLLRGDLAKMLILHRDSRTEGRQLRSAFPFEVVNLDFTNSLFWIKNPNPISANLAAIDKLVQLQAANGARKFALFVTTRAEREELATVFIQDLVRRVDTNLLGSKGFRRGFRAAYNLGGGAELLDSRYDEFVPLGVVKLIAEVLAKQDYQILDCDACLLIRRRSARACPKEEWLLHTVFLVKGGAVPDLGALGRTPPLERRVTQYLRNRAAGPVPKLIDPDDVANFSKAHGEYVARLASMSFGVSTPEPENG